MWYESRYDFFNKDDDFMVCTRSHFLETLQKITGENFERLLLELEEHTKVMKNESYLGETRYVYDW